MAVIKKQKLMLTKLKKQLMKLQRREEASRHKLRSAMLKVKKLGRVFRDRLALHSKKSKENIAKAQSAVYHKVANEFGRHMMKLAGAKEKIEKKSTQKVVARVNKMKKSEKKPAKKMNSKR